MRALEGERTVAQVAWLAAGRTGLDGLHVAARSALWRGIVALALHEPRESICHCCLAQCTAGWYTADPCSGLSFGRPHANALVKGTELRGGSQSGHRGDKALDGCLSQGSWGGLSPRRP